MNIEAGVNGVERVVSRPTNISEASKAAELSAKTAFAVRMLHESITESDETTVPISEQGNIFVPRGEIDGEYVEFEALPLYVPEGPRSVFNNPPKWIVDVLRQLYPTDSVWGVVESLPGGEAEVVETILATLGTVNDGFLDHYGWVEHEDYGTILVSEPYGLDANQFEKLRTFCANGGLTYRIVGFSNHYPSRTLRIEIWKA